MSEHLLDGSDVPIGEIWVETAEMPAETFTEADARAVRTLVDHYGLNLHVHRDVDPEHPETYLLTEAVEPPALVDNPTSI